MIVDRRHMREELATLLGMLMQEPPLPRTAEDEESPPSEGSTAPDAIANVPADASPDTDHSAENTETP